MIALDAISKGFGGRLLLREASWRIGRGERIGLVGPNGAGKTTLCRILAGEEPPDAGHVHRDTGVSVGYLPQDVGGHEAGTVLAEALSGFEEVWRLEAELERLAGLMADPTAGEAATERYGEIQHRFEALGGYRLEAQAKVILGGLGFAPDDVHRSLAEFLGGWRMRAALARLLLLAPDLSSSTSRPTTSTSSRCSGWRDFSRRTRAVWSSSPTTGISSTVWSPPSRRWRTAPSPSTWATMIISSSSARRARPSSRRGRATRPSAWPRSSVS